MAEPPQDALPHSRLRNLPIAWFAMIMGLAGLSIAWDRAEALFGLPFAVSPALLGLSTVLFLLLGLAHAAKVVKHRKAAAQEWTHPIKLNFGPTLSVSLLLLSIAWLPHNVAWSALLWTTGTLLHLLLTLHVLGQWLHSGKFELAHLNPAWFIPVVGNILVPIAGVDHAPAEISWFFFSIGVIFWPMLLTLLIYRLIFHGGLPERLMPTLFILIAPPAAGFLAYMQLSDGLDGLARLLYYSGLFFTLLLLASIRRFLRLRFSLSWWAYSFPLAAISIATLAMFHYTRDGLFLRLAGILLGITSVVIAGLLWRTLLATIRREVCIED